ncbi:MAG: FAD binding domain-containing protein [Ignavibacteriales bacterium]
MAEVDYLRPAGLDEALEVMARSGPAARVMAGGTDLIVNLRERSVACKQVLDIKGIPEMHDLLYDPGKGLTVGGAVTISELVTAGPVVRNYPILVEAGKTLANALVRNRATLVGNLCNASPAGDMAPAALVLGAKVIAASRAGQRSIPLEEFFVGVKMNALRPDEIALRVEIPPAAGKGAYMRRSRIRGHDLSQVGVAGFLTDEGRLSLALGAVAPVPVLIRDFDRVQREALWRDAEVLAIVEKVKGRVNPISDQRASREYRLAMVEYLTKQVLERLGRGV